MLKIPAILITLIVALSSWSVNAEQEATPSWAYHRLHPEIVTNYISQERRMGYVKTSIELMVSSASSVSLLELHDPLLRDAIIEIFGQQTEEEVRSIEGKERIRQKCLERVNDLLVQETGRKLVEDLLFTTYFYE